MIPPDLPPLIYVPAPRRRWGLVVGLLLLSFVAGAVVAMVASPDLRDAIGMGPGPTSLPSQTPTPSPTPTTPPPPGIGDPVQDNPLEFVVTAMSCDHESVEWGILHESAAGQYCLADISVRNTGGLPELFVDRDQYLLADDGSRHRADATAGIIANRGISVWANVILAGRTVTGTLVFDIPDGNTPAVVELHADRTSDGTLVTIGPMTSAPTGP